MLYTDSDIITAADLRVLDPSAEETAAVEEIKLDGDDGVIRQAHDECGFDLITRLEMFDPQLYSAQLGYLPGTFGLVRPRLRLAQIVAGDVSVSAKALKQWIAYRALQLLYRAASGRKMNDRYERKEDRLEDDVKRAWWRLLELGAPYVAQPLSAPGAIHEVLSGPWTSDNVTTVAGGSAAEAVYEVVVTYVDSSKYLTAAKKNNGESAGSAVIAVTVPASNVIKVDITTLNPPDGTYPLGYADGVTSRLKATGWNVYVGAPGGYKYLQNSSPVAIATKTYTLAAAPVLSGYMLMPGQYPDANHVFTSTLSRG